MPKTVTTPSTNLSDKFYTRPPTVDFCLAHLHEVLPDIEADLFVEPAAGDGVFLERVPEPRIGMNIAPDAPGIETGDFLSWTPEDADRRIVVVGNPPFGHNAALAIRFFNTAAEYAQVIAMILPASLMKSSMHARLDKRFHLVSEKPLPGEQFRVGEGLHRINAVFQIWRRGPEPRPRTTARTAHPDFSFVATPSEADFAVRRVGARAGAILPLPSTTARGYSPASNYFIKASGCDPEWLEAEFRRLDFNEVRDRVVAVPSISRGEIVALYEAQLALERPAKSGSSPLHIQPFPSTELGYVAPDLDCPSEAGADGLAAVIIRHRSNRLEDRSSPELVAFRRLSNGEITPVLQTALSGKARRHADRLLADLLARDSSSSRASGPCDRISVVFNSGVLHLDRLADDERRLHFETRPTMGCDATLLELDRMYHGLGNKWLAEWGDPDPSTPSDADDVACAFALARNRIAA